MKIFPGEKNFNPHYMHLQISQKYEFLVLNENLRFVEYQPGGMSNSMLKQYRNSPNSFVEMRKLFLSFPNASFKFKFRNSVHLVAESVLAGTFRKQVKEAPCREIVILAIPFGLLLSVYIKAKTK